MAASTEKPSRVPYVVKFRRPKPGGNGSYYLLCGRIFLGPENGSLVWNDREEEYALFPDEDTENAWLIKLKKKGKDKSFYAICGRIFMHEKDGKVTGSLTWHHLQVEYAVWPDEPRDATDKGVAAAA